MTIALQTVVTPPQSSLRLSHKQPLLLLGSCFSDHIAQRLSHSGFNTYGNPFGTLYNPLSIAACLHRTLHTQPITPQDLVFHNDLWHSWLHHGSFSHPNQQTCLDRCNLSLQTTAEALHEGSTLIVTFGTAYTYTLHNGTVVSNCHKLPAANFSRRRLSVEEIVEVWQPLIEQLSQQGIRTLFTVSPIRHLADTAHGNQLSKSTLLLAIEQLKADYFPAYEIMLDELRDYRFYDRDMTHPSEVAVDIIWQRFQQCYMTQETQLLCEKFQQLHKMQAHRPLFPESEAYRKHQERLLNLQQELSKSI